MCVFVEVELVEFWVCCCLGTFRFLVFCMFIYFVVEGVLVRMLFWVVVLWFSALISVWQVDLGLGWMFCGLGFD